MFAIPSLSSLAAQARAALNANLSGCDSWLPLNNLGPVAKIVAEELWTLFGRLDWVGEQAFPATATGTYLDRHAFDFGLSRKAPSAALGSVTITSGDVVGVPAGTNFLRSDGALYASTAAVSLSAAGSVNVAVVALSTGSASNSLAGTPLTIVPISTAPMTGPGAATATAAVATGGIAEGLDTELDGDPYTLDPSTLRGRLLFRLQNPPQGGAPADYVAWCSAYPGVTRVYVERLWLGAGTIRVFPIFDALFASTGGVADSAHIQAVADLVATEAPGDAQITVIAPTAQPINVTINRLVPNTTAMQQAVIAELQAAFARLGAVSGNDGASAGQLAAMPFLAAPATFSLSWIWQAALDAAGVSRDQVTSPTADVTIAAGCIPTLGTVTFTVI